MTGFLIYYSVCSNGTIVCPRNYNFPSGQWPEESLIELKGDIVQMFYQQHQHDVHFEIVLNHIVNNVAGEVLQILTYISVNSCKLKNESNVL